MLVRALKLRMSVDEFIRELAWGEKNAAARDKLDRLRLEDDDWNHVTLFTSLLAHADNAQQAFSSDQYPSLALAIPALESLHRAWSKCLNNPKYAPFHPALAAALDTIKSYYELTADSDAYLISMVLDPCRKMQYFKRNWTHELQTSALADIKALDVIRLDSTSAPWEREFEKYLNAEDDMPLEMSLVTWWGMNVLCYPVWVSLAQDYLTVMASSVFSKHAFSSAGITITKRHNRLKADVVEALQGLKCALRTCLLICELGLSSIYEEQLEIEEALEEELVESAAEIALKTDDGMIVLELELDSDTEED
ncbi:hypothetical protein EWM64_g10574 [Hericium alpestre]|uniref:HAT C-terminal dimerisation domain-containing protein n=1 Tax=Hericium alpestre TaxID=135208 RepID=A0A4Y9ZI68_9AGAM|nr:hypothetical protein EWM64_g10574 [Hericium alpestre]